MTRTGTGGKPILTYEDLLRAPDDLLRRELLGGELVVTPAPSPIHQRTVKRVEALLDAHARTHGGESLFAPIDVVLSVTDVVEPDNIYIGPERIGIIGERSIRGAPTVVVEVLAPSTSEIDRGAKLALYARHNVPEYWIVDPKARRVTIHALPTGDAYAEVRELGPGERLSSPTLADLDVSVDALFPQ